TEARVERAATETERRGGARLVALRSPQRLDDGLLLDHGERLRLRRGVVGHRGRGRHAGPDPGDYDDAEVGRWGDLAIGKDQRALDSVLQLSNVSGPLVNEEQMARILAEARLAPSHPRGERREEVVREHEHVAAPHSQRGEVDAKHGQAIVQIRAEPTL